MIGPQTIGKKLTKAHRPTGFLHILISQFNKFSTSYFKMTLSSLLLNGLYIREECRKINLSLIFFSDETQGIRLNIPMDVPRNAS